MVIFVVAMNESAESLLFTSPFSCQFLLFVRTLCDLLNRTNSNINISIINQWDNNPLFGRLNSRPDILEASLGWITRWNSNKMVDDERRGEEYRQSRNFRVRLLKVRTTSQLNLLRRRRFGELY